MFGWLHIVSTLFTSLDYDFSNKYTDQLLHILTFIIFTIQDGFTCLPRLGRGLGGLKGYSPRPETNVSTNTNIYPEREMNSCLLDVKATRNTIVE